MKANKLLSTQNVVIMGMLSALAAVLMMFEVPLLFVAPFFYGLDFAEVPMMVGTFALGPVCGVIMQVVKILIKLMMKPTTTAFVGEFANLVVGCALVLPAGIIYKKINSKKGALIGMLVGTITMVVVGVVLNALVIIPFYSNSGLMPLEKIIAAGNAINPAVSNIWTFAIICVGPFNLIKGFCTSLITAIIYKRIRFMIHSISSGSGTHSKKVKA
ncbi:MAG: ECF transporter S component [Lachnospiraceae bacterium]